MAYYIAHYWYLYCVYTIHVHNFQRCVPILFRCRPREVMYILWFSHTPDVFFRFFLLPYLVRNTTVVHVLIGPNMELPAQALGSGLQPSVPNKTAQIYIYLIFFIYIKLYTSIQAIPCPTLTIFCLTFYPIQAVHYHTFSFFSILGLDQRA